MEFDTGRTSLQRREVGGQLTDPFGREFTAILPPAGGHMKVDLSKLEEKRNKGRSLIIGCKGFRFR